MSWDQVLMAFVDKMLNSDIDINNVQDFYITRQDVITFTGLSATAVSNNLSVCVKNCWLRRVEVPNGNKGRVVRYYIGEREIDIFVKSFLR